MRVGIAIGTISLDSPWLTDLLASLEGCRWPVWINVTRDWELATIAAAARRFDEFVFLPESTVILDQGLFDRCFLDHAGKSVNLGTAQGLRLRMYLAKYRIEAINQLGVPLVRDKNEAILHEVHWCMAYAGLEAQRGNLIDVGGPLEHTDIREERHGRVNMVVSNEYLTRYKGSWGQ